VDQLPETCAGVGIVSASVKQNTRRRIALCCAVAAAVAWAAVCFGNDALRALESGAPSRSIGTRSTGRLVHGKRLPSSGENFSAYSRLCALLGRNAVHGAVCDTVLASYRTLARTHPHHFFVYGETGWPWGGRFRPHRTHQNGLSVDFMVPVRDRRTGSPARLRCSPLNLFCYELEFDAAGVQGNREIDFAAIEAHLEALAAAAPAHGLRIERVILAPEYHAKVARARDRLPFMQGRAWIRHDEHYHVDFAG
jgi:penicillin-insensitive murein DD-endopeptidase